VAAGSGRRLGDYELVERVSSGGEGTVYKARCAVDTNANVKQGAIVALKVLRHTGDDATSRARYEREIKSFLTLSHPNIVQYEDSFVEQDEWGEDLRCIAVEFLHGSDLKQLLANNPGGLPVERLKNIFVQTLEALCYACDKGIIHRDISPSNIFVEPDGVVKVIDFGIARRKDSETATTSGFKGKFDYMAPDFLKTEDNFRGDEQSDVFSLGVCFYEALTGRLPFSGERDTGSVGYLSRWHQEEPPEPQLDLPVFRVMNDATSVFVRKILTSDRSKRYAAFLDVLADLEGVQCRRVKAKSGVYEFVKYLGKGGFGEVFKTRRVSDGEIFAVKHLFAGHDPARFVREARLLQEHAHASIVRYEDFVRLERLGGEDLYLIIEFMDGMPEWSLRNRLREEGALDLAEMRRLFADYLDALHFLHTAHEKPIVHRDITPANLYAPPTDCDQKPKIFDLGIARSEKTHTSGRVPGNPQYMPPELILDANARGTPQSDIFNIGLCLYECACGQPAFGHLPRETMRMWNEVMRRVEGKVEINFELAVFNSHPQLKRIVERAIQRKPEERFGSAGEMRDALLAKETAADEGQAEPPPAPAPSVAAEEEPAAPSPTGDEAETPPKPRKGDAFVLSEEDLEVPPEEDDELDTVATWALGMEPPPDAAAPAEEEEDADGPATAATRAAEFLQASEKPPPPEPDAFAIESPGDEETLFGLGGPEVEDEEDAFPGTAATVGLGMDDAPTLDPLPREDREPKRAMEFPPPQPRAKDIPEPVAPEPEEKEEFPDTVAATEAASRIGGLAPAPRKAPAGKLVWGGLAAAAVAAIAVGGWFYLQKRSTFAGVAELMREAGPFEPTAAHIRDLRSRVQEIDERLQGNETPWASATRSEAATRWGALPDDFSDAFGAALAVGELDQADAIVRAWRESEADLVFGDISENQVAVVRESMASRYKFALGTRELEEVKLTAEYVKSLADVVEKARSGEQGEPLASARAWWVRTGNRLAKLRGPWTDKLSEAMGAAAAKRDARELRGLLAVLEEAHETLPPLLRAAPDDAARKAVRALLDGEAEAVLAAYRDGDEVRATERHKAFRGLPQRLPELYRREEVLYAELRKKVDAEQIKFVRDSIASIPVAESAAAYKDTETELGKAVSRYKRLAADWTAAQREGVEREGRVRCMEIANKLAANSGTADLLEAFKRAVPAEFGKKDVSDIASDWLRSRKEIEDAQNRLSSLSPLLTASAPASWKKGLDEWRNLKFEQEVFSTAAVKSKWEEMASTLEKSLLKHTAECNDGAQLSVAREVLEQAGEQGVFTAAVMARLRGDMNVRSAVLDLDALAALFQPEDMAKLDEGLKKWRGLNTSSAAREHKDVRNVLVTLERKFDGAVTRYLADCKRLDELAAVEALLAGTGSVPGAAVVRRLRETLDKTRDRLVNEAAARVALLLDGKVMRSLAADDPASWEQAFAEWSGLGIAADVRGHKAVTAKWTEVENTFLATVSRFADALRPEERRNGLLRVEKIISGKAAQTLLGADARSTLRSSLDRQMSKFALAVRNATRSPLTIALAGKELGVLEAGQRQAFTVPVEGGTVALTCAGTAAYEPHRETFTMQPGGGLVLSVPELKAKPRKLVAPRLSLTPPAAATCTAIGGAKPTAIGSGVLLAPGNYQVAYVRDDYMPQTVALKIEPGEDPVTAPPPGDWRPTTALASLQKLEQALSGGNPATVNDGLVELVSVSKYVWDDHRKRAQQAVAKWRKLRTEGVTVFWRQKRYDRARDACGALAEAFVKAGRSDAVDVCRFNAAMCRYMSHAAGSQQRLQAAEDLLALAGSRGVVAVANANEEREWVDLLKRKVGGYVKLRKKRSAFASMDEGEATACIQKRKGPFPLPD